VPDWSTTIFWYLLTVLDPIGNILLLFLAVVAFALRKYAPFDTAIRWTAAHPGAVAAGVFPMLCAGSLYAFHGHPLSMDEYSALFQAEIFAAGRLSGTFPTELLGRLNPPWFQNMFLSASPITGAVSATAWPGFSLILAPFVWLGAPWAANPAIGALSVLAIHRLVHEVSGSREAAGWAVLFTLASPAFVVNCITFYSMPAHLLMNVLYALLLLKPSATRALAAGLVGSLALTLHNPLPHLLFAVPFIAWLAGRRGSLGALAVLAATYAAVGGALGLGWKLYLSGMTAAAAAASPAASSGPAPGGFALLLNYLSVFVLPSAATIAQRIAGLAKLWSWAACGLVVLAAWGFWQARDRTPARLLAAAMALTFLGYFAVPFDQGHGWGYRYMHSAWFALPLFAAMAVSASATPGGAELRGMAAWGILLCLLFANGLRLAQVEGFATRQTGQVPPLARAATPERSEVIFINPRGGFYIFDLIQNDPFLRSPRIVLTMRPAERLDGFMAARFPGYVRAASGQWGEHWVKP
jgi:hypothetical protein